MSFIGDFTKTVERGVSNFCVEAVTPYLKPQWIGEALAETGRASVRVRKLPAQFVLWLLAAMGVFKEISIANVIRKIGCPLGLESVWDPKRPPSSTAVTKARDRLGVEPLVLLHQRVARSLCERFGGEMCCKGLLVVAFDGVTFKVADSGHNTAYFGLPGSSRGQAAYPQMRAVFITSAKHHFVLGGAFAPYRTGETTLARHLVRDMPAGRLALLDRNFVSYEFLCEILMRQSHFIVRLKKNIKTQRIVKLGEGEWLSLFKMPSSVRKKHTSLPQAILVREIEREIESCKPLRLAASLINPVEYPASEIFSLYAQRWEAEMVHDEIKTRQCKATTVNRPLICRSKRPQRVIQEALGLIIAYNLIRAIMAEAAQCASLPPLRISFTSALERIREAVMRMAASRTDALPWLYRSLIKDIANMRLPPRRKRTNPRAVKIKMSGYPLKRKKRKPCVA